MIKYDKKLGYLTWDFFDQPSIHFLHPQGENADICVLYGLQESADQYVKKNVGSVFSAPHFFYSVTEALDIKNANFGSFNAALVNDFHIYLKFASPLAVDMAFSVVLYEHNWMNHQRGEIQRIFAVQKKIFFFSILYVH